jgi:protein-S-isoprenylcysteine O-methyltransferase Ste14
MERSGQWLFRWRSYVPAIVLVLLIVAMHKFEYIGDDHRLDLMWEALCLFISMSGLAIRAWTVGYTPAGTSGRNVKGQVADTLNTKGTYSLVRHPLYVGNYLMWLGVAMFPHAWWVVLVMTLIFWIHYERVMMAEERFLIQKFGDDYLDWARNTPAFIPRFSGYRRPDVAFSLRNVLKREYAGFFAVVLSMFMLEVIGDYWISGHLQFDAVWVALIAISAVIYLALRTLKRHTQLLNVEGR